MKVIYEYLGTYLWECEEGSLMDLVLKDIQQRQREDATRHALFSIKNNIPVIVRRKEHRDILYHLERGSCA